MANRERLLWSMEDAPVDDEPLTEMEERALAEAESDVAEGRVVSHREARWCLLGTARQKSPVRGDSV